MQDFFKFGARKHIADTEKREWSGSAGDVFDAGSEDVGKFYMEKKN